MLELTRQISLSRLPPRRALGLAIAFAIGVTAILALLMPGGHGSTPRSAGGGRAPASVPALIAHSFRRVCRHGFPAGSGVAASGPASASRPGRSSLGRTLDAVLRAARRRLHVPATTAAVVVCGRVVWADATGVLDLSSQRPATNQTLFVLNSAAKTFVATMIMREIQAGRLSLRTRLSRFYPWLPNAAQISVRMLLNMTSGLPDYLYNPQIDRVMDRDPRHRWTVDQLLTGLGSGLGTPRFLPGHRFQYSDTNYIVLGAILEHITHRSVERDFQELIARPLGMRSATFVPTPAAKALIAHPYLRSRRGVLTSRWIQGFGVPSAVWGPVFTDGGLATSSLDLASFGNALFGGRLVDATALGQMSQIGPGDYGFGLRGRSFGGHYWLGHRGYFGGFEAEGWTDPTRQLTIAVATNLQIAGGAPTSTAVWTDLARAVDRQNLDPGRPSVG